jgi:hypothetical protein
VVPLCLRCLSNDVADIDVADIDVADIDEHAVTMFASMPPGSSGYYARACPDPAEVALDHGRRFVHSSTI